MLLKSDQEPAMIALQERVKQLRCNPGERTFLENSPVAESQSHGVIEKAVQEIETQARTLMSALEARLRAKIPCDHPMASWLVEYAAALLNLYREGKDGKTPMERLKGDKHGRPMAEFGEQILYMPLGDRPAFPEPRFLEGTWLGIDLRTGEVLIGTRSGVVRARTIRRRLEGERWSAEEALGIKGTPWEPTPGVNPELIPTAVRRPPVAGEDMEVPPAAEPGLTARRTPLRKADFVSFGYTSGCPACVNLESEGEIRKGHAEVCRKRIEAYSMKSGRRIRTHCQCSHEDA